MAMNYVLLWIARGNVGGNYHSFCESGTRQGSEALRAAIETWQNANPTGIIEFISPAYFLYDKDNVLSLIKTAIAHNPSMWGSTWTFLQDGLIPKSSPKDRGRKGWWKIDTTYWP